ESAQLFAIPLRTERLGKPHAPRRNGPASASGRLVCLGAALAVACGVALGPRPAAAAEESKGSAADLSGHWKVNKALSDDVQGKPGTSPEGESGHEASAPRAGADAALQGPRSGRGSHGSAGSRTSRPSVPAPDDDPRGPQKVAEAGETLTITQTEVEIAVVDKTGQARSLYPNGKTYKADDGASDVRSYWKDGSLVVEKKNVRGWRLTETWQLAPDRSRLTVVWHLEGGSRPKSNLKRVYDRVEPSP
ncbi:MAG TPA: hypothetical protein VL691_07500, partial [Vicinamibacteria bacterium]|nr:hypothetical protein [Vicinamibacteria bacterium]